MSRIFHIVYECNPGCFRGGVTKVAFSLAKAQNEARPAEIWTIRSPNEEAIQQVDGLMIRRFPGRKILGVVRSRVMYRKLLNELRPGDVVHSHCSFHPLNGQAFRAAMRTGAKAFFHTHGALDPALIQGLSPKRIKKRLYISIFESKQLRRSDGVFALTALEREQLTEIGVDAALHVVPNGVDASSDTRPDQKQASRLKEAWRISDASKVLLFVGRIHPKKCLHDIVESLRLLSDVDDKLVLLIVGDPNQFPDYVARLKGQIESSGLVDRVRWLGFRDEQQKRDVYSVSDIFLHASSSEGMAMSILEAMGAGIPVVATRGCYMHEAAGADAVVECEQGASSVSEGLRKLVSSAEMCHRVSENARRYVREVHDWTQIANRTLSIYDKAQRSRQRQAP